MRQPLPKLSDGTRLRILHILNHVGRTGNGIVNVTVDLACDQADAGHDVTVVSAGGEYETLLGSHGVRHERCVQRRSLRSLVGAGRRFRTIVHERSPDIVHASMTTGLIIAWALRLGRRYRLISSIHTHRISQERIMGLADKVIAVSDQVATTMRRNGIRAEKISVVQNGTIGSPRFETASTGQAMPLQRPSIVVIAGMYERKGIADLLRAFERIAETQPYAHLYIVGDGPDRKAFEAIAAALTSRDRIHFVGFVSEPITYLLATDVFVLPSHAEPSGLVLAEAREAGCAIVASDVGGIPEVLDGGRAGLLVPPRDPARLADALHALLADPQRRRELGTAARQNLDRLTVSRMAFETLEVYRRSIASR